MKTGEQQNKGSGNRSPCTSRIKDATAVYSGAMKEANTGSSKDPREREQSLMCTRTPIISHFTALGVGSENAARFLWAFDDPPLFLHVKNARVRRALISIATCPQSGRKMRLGPGLAPSPSHSVLKRLFRPPQWLERRKPRGAKSDQQRGGRCTDGLFWTHKLLLKAV